MLDGEKRILVVGAHPDDCEFSMGGTAIKFKNMGNVVKFVYATNGDAGHHNMFGEVLAKRRFNEVKDGCEAFGIEYEIMDNHDGLLEASIANRLHLISIIRKFKPDMIFTHRINDYHPDHRNTAQLVQDSSYLVIVPNICKEVTPLNYAPAIFYLCDFFKKPLEFKPDVIISIDDIFNSKVDMLNCHESQVYEWLPWTGGNLDKVPVTEQGRLAMLHNWVVERDKRVASKYRDMLIERYGLEAGNKVVCAEAFELSEYGQHIEKDKLPDYFPL